MTECEGALEVVEFIRMSLIQPLYGMAHHHAAWISALPGMSPASRFALRGDVRVHDQYPYDVLRSVPVTVLFASYERWAMWLAYGQNRPRSCAEMSLGSLLAFYKYIYLFKTFYDNFMLHFIIHSRNTSMRRCGLGTLRRVLRRSREDHLTEARPHGQGGQWECRDPYVTSTVKQYSECRRSHAAGRSCT
jgi:hypothetical protein